MAPGGGVTGRRRKGRNGAGAAAGRRVTGRGESARRHVMRRRVGALRWGARARFGRPLVLVGVRAGARARGRGVSPDRPLPTAGPPHGAAPTGALCTLAPRVPRPERLPGRGAARSSDLRWLRGHGRVRPRPCPAPTSGSERDGRAAFPQRSRSVPTAFPQRSRLLSAALPLPNAGFSRASRTRVLLSAGSRGKAFFGYDTCRRDGLFRQVSLSHPYT